MTELTAWAVWVEQHAVVVVVSGILLVGFGLAAVLAARKVRKSGKTEDVLTYVAALIATGVAATGMWKFFQNELDDLHWSIRVLVFGFIEVAVFTSAVRARRNMRTSAQRIKDEDRTWEKPSAGVDHKAVWVLTCLSAILATVEAESLGEAIVRLAAPLVAAWLWERGMAIERDSIVKRSSTIAWKVTPERLLIKLGLADPTTRDASEVAVHRYVTQLALAANRLRELEETGGSDRKQRAARKRLAKARDAAVEFASLGTDTAVMDMLIEQLRVMYNTPAMARLTLTAPWDLSGAIEGVEVEVNRTPEQDPEHDPTPPNGGGTRPGELPAPTPPPTPPSLPVLPVNGHREPVTANMSERDRDTRHDHVPPVLPAGFPISGSGPEQVRAAVAAMGVDLFLVPPQDVHEWLTARGSQISQDNARTALNRERAKANAEMNANRVTNLRRVPPATGSAP